MIPRSRHSRLSDFEWLQATKIVPGLVFAVNTQSEADIEEITLRTLRLYRRQGQEGCWSYHRGAHAACLGLYRQMTATAGAAA